MSDHVFGPYKESAEIVFGPFSLNLKYIFRLDTYHLHGSYFSFHFFKQSTEMGPFNNIRRLCLYFFLNSTVLFDLDE